MAGLSVHKAIIWQKKLSGNIADVSRCLKHFAEARIKLQLVTSYINHESDGNVVIEVYPVTDEVAAQAARTAGMEPSEEINAVLVEGDDQPGITYRIVDALVAKNLSLRFFTVQVMDSKFLGLFTFGSDADAGAASECIRTCALKTSNESRSSFFPPPTSQSPNPNYGTSA